ncbi:MAG: hypothetical protein JRJ15_08275 [Deltaproteobacteria bacterium]|nr:hypothetical protein [Deltaproteobacteria bacterium]
MNDSQLESNSAKTKKAPQIARGKQANTPVNAVIVGGGEDCHSLLEILHDASHSGLNMKILGVSDLNPEAPGLQYARKRGLFTTTDFNDLFTLEDINLVIELTGSTKVREKISTSKPSGASVLGHEVSRIIWDLLQIGTEKTNLERERKQYEIKSKNKTQLILDSTVNQTFLKELGVTKEQAQGKHCFELRYNLDKPCKEAGLICFLEDQLDDLINKGSFSTVREFENENGETRFEVITTAPILACSNIRGLKRHHGKS